jgi:4'-phosphopantetheinyl transferase
VAETARVATLATPALRLRSGLARLGLRRVLGTLLHCRADDVLLGTTGNGKPVINKSDTDLTFNLSHTSDMALLAVSRAIDVGVDLERSDEHLCADTAAGFISADEADAAASERLLIWVRKEAAAKCVGVGLSIDPRCIRLSRSAKTQHLSASWSVIEPATWRGIRVDEVAVGREHYAAVATRGGGAEPRIHPVCHLTVDQLLQTDALRTNVTSFAARCSAARLPRAREAPVCEGPVCEGPVCEAVV